MLEVEQQLLQLPQLVEVEQLLQDQMLICRCSNLAVLET